MIPPARDPRMDRPSAPPQASTTIVLGPPTEGVTTSQHAPAPRRGGGGGGGGRSPWVLVGLLALGLLAILPRAVAYPTLVGENLALKDKLQGIDQRMDEVDRILARLRLYDAQLRSLTEASGDHGPLPEDALSNAGVLEYYQDLEEDTKWVGGPLVGSGDGLADAGEDLDEVPVVLQPADRWADEVAGRIDDFVELFEMSEADLAALMADFEQINAISRSLPSYWPAEGRLTSGFGWRRDPLRRYTKFHSGIDIANLTGTRVHAAADGVVVKSRYTSGYGNTIEIDHGFGIVTRYAHLSRRRVRAGERVDRGDLIATMGSTGRSTGPHLHFELLIDGSAHDPLKYLPR